MYNYRIEGIAMDPTKGVFSWDYHRYVLQDLTAQPLPPRHPTKKFEINNKLKSEKTKKDQEKKKKNDR